MKAVADAHDAVLGERLKLAFSGLATFVRHHVLAHPERYDWSLQGFGMLRTYVSRELRLHIWDDRFRVKNVSDIHDHPWHFESLVLSGEIRNRRFDDTYPTPMQPATHHKGLIICGSETDVKTATIERDVHLYDTGVQLIASGGLYRQKADEVHRTDFTRGTVTLIAREWTEKDPERALVYWPIGETWTPGHPRPATVTERNEICAYAREHWRWP